MQRISFLVPMALVALVCAHLPNVVSAEDIYTPGNNSSLRFKWDSNESAGKHTIEELFPTDQGAANKDKSDVIKWTWDKPDNKWAGWGMQWRGWNRPIDFFRLVGQPADMRVVSSAAAEKFDSKAAGFDLVFYVKGYVADPQHVQHVTVKFDGQGDTPSRAIGFLNHIYDDKGNKTKLSATEFNMARVPLNEFKIVRSRINAGKIKQIIFGTPSLNNSSAELYLYNIRIVANAGN